MDFHKVLNTPEGQIMNKDNELYRIVWTQTYDAWPVEAEEEIVDLTLAQEVLARIMLK